MTDRDEALLKMPIDDLVTYMFCGVLDEEDCALLLRMRPDDYMEACWQAEELDMSYQEWCRQHSEEVEHYEL